METEIKFQHIQSGPFHERQVIGSEAPPKAASYGNDQQVWTVAPTCPEPFTSFHGQDFPFLQNKNQRSPPGVTTTVLGTGQNKCSNHIESGFLHENASAKTTTIKIVCEKWGLGYHYLWGKAMIFPGVIYWTIKKGEHWTLVLEKTLESPLVSKEIKPVNPKGNQPWTVTARTDAKAPIL